MALGALHWKCRKSQGTTAKGHFDQQPFQTFTTIDESEDQPLEPPPGFAAKGPIEVNGFEVRRKADDQSWPKLKELEPSTNNQQPKKLAPKMPKVSNRGSWKPVDHSDIGDVRFIAPVEKRKATSVCQMTFHVTDASKILASVNRMIEGGNNVVFAKPCNGGSYVQSPAGKKAYMEMRKGIYVMDVVFFDGESAVQGEIVVDSGAADNVMPSQILNNLELREPEPRVKFVAAGGHLMGNYGRKDVQFLPLAFWEAEYGSPFQGRA